MRDPFVEHLKFFNSFKYPRNFYFVESFAPASMMFQGYGNRGVQMESNVGPVQVVNNY